VIFRGLLNLRRRRIRRLIKGRLWSWRIYRRSFQGVRRFMRRKCGKSFLLRININRLWRFN
jgi:hypothetical protein